MNNNLDYRIELVKISEDEGGGYLATVPKLPGCMSDGETPEEAIKSVRDAIKCWIETAKELNREIPKPDEFKSEDDYSGKLSLRIPKYVHRQLAERAKEENCSINQLIQSYISMGLGYEIGKKQISINLFKGHHSSISDKVNEVLQEKWSENEYRFYSFINSETVRKDKACSSDRFLIRR